MVALGEFESWFGICEYVAPTDDEAARALQLRIVCERLSRIFGKAAVGEELRPTKRSADPFAVAVVN